MLEQPQAADMTQRMMERNRTRQLRCSAFSCLISAHLRAAYDVLWSIIISAGLLRDLKKFNIFSCSFLPCACRRLASRKRATHTSFHLPARLNPEHEGTLCVKGKYWHWHPLIASALHEKRWSSPFPCDSFRWAPTVFIPSASGGSLSQRGCNSLSYSL